MGFDDKYDFDPPVILLGLLLWPPHQNLFIIWVILAVPWDMRVLPKSWLSVQQCWIEIWSQSFGGKRKCSFVSLPGKREHSRLPPQELCYPLEQVVRSFIVRAHSLGYEMKLKAVKGLNSFLFCIFYDQSWHKQLSNWVLCPWGYKPRLWSSFWRSKGVLCSKGV